VIWRADYRQVVRFNWNNHSWSPTKWKFAVLELWLTHALLPLHKLYTGKFLPLIFAVLLLWYNSMHVSIFMCVFLIKGSYLLIDFFVVCTERRRTIFLCKWDELVFNSRYRLSVVLHFANIGQVYSNTALFNAACRTIILFRKNTFPFSKCCAVWLRERSKWEHPPSYFSAKFGGIFPSPRKQGYKAKNPIGYIKITPYPRAVHLLVLRSKD